MKTTSNKSNSKNQALLAVIGILASVLFIACVVLHMTPSVMADTILDFAVHHYFLMGFICLTVALACFKIYTSLDEKLKDRFQKRNITTSRSKKKRIMMFKKLRELYTIKLADQSEFIKTELVSKLKFTGEDVLKDGHAKEQRERDLQKAMVLGNSFKQKVILRLKDYKSKKHIMTTVWHSNGEHITLKGGIVIPVKNIYKIEF